MAYLRLRDYVKSIQLQNLNQILNQDDSIRIEAEKASIEKVKSYLVQKFNVDEEFTDLQVYSLSAIYPAGITVELNGNVYSSTQSYANKDIMVYNGSVYYNSGSTITNIDPTSTASTWNNLGFQYTLYHTILPKKYFKFDHYYYAGDKVYWNGKIYTCVQPGAGYYPDVNTPTAPGKTYWELGTTYTVPAGTLPSNTTYYALGDFRSLEMVYNLIDIVLYIIHKRIAPSNIPDLRVKAYDDAIAWLKDIYNGMVTPNLLTLTPRQGGRFRIGSNLKNANTY